MVAKPEVILRQQPAKHVATGPQPGKKQLQIITPRWRTIELKSKQDVKGSQLEDASSRYI